MTQKYQMLSYMQMFSPGMVEALASIPCWHSDDEEFFYHVSERALKAHAQDCSLKKKGDALRELLERWVL